MKLKELIEKYEEYENGLFDFGAKITCQNFLKDLQQLDEPPKVKVPQYVADWIEEAKRTTYNIRGAIEMAQDVRVKDWLELKNIDTFARAWLDGYEVEKEKRYLVKVKSTGQCLSKYYINNEILSPRFIYTGRNADEFTRKELEEADFGWVFDCPGVEVTEVTE